MLFAMLLPFLGPANARAALPQTQPQLSSMRIENLRCEYLSNPLGIDAAAPRLSWELQSEERAVRQSAYQILVASSQDLLAKDQGDLWDSGKQSSDETAQIGYAGEPLSSRTDCWWKVRAWDGADHPTDWSVPAYWEMGLLKPEDWHAQWIQAQPMPIEATFKLVQGSYESVDGKITKDVTALLADHIHDGILEVRADSKTLGGDPALNHHKQLRVSYEVAGEPREEIVPEGGTLRLPRVAIPYLRKSFSADKPIKQARLYATALGLYELRLNGQRVGDHVLAPDWTDYRKRVRYQVYDVTAQLQTGENTLGALVGNGWYCGHIGNGGFRVWGQFPALLAQLEITYADGTTDRIVSDSTWKAHPGPILRSDFMLGESYDARDEIAGWDQPKFDDGSWAAAAACPPPPCELDGQVMQPVRVLAELAPKTLTEPTPGHWTFDLGQNMVGVVRLKVNAAPGTSLTLHHGEILNSDGSLYTTNLRGAPSIDTYICRGGGTEVWQPRFTFHGFRYVELTGLPPGRPSMDTVTGVVIGSDTPRAGEFSCSDPRINQLQSNIQWGQRGNFVSVPTDCPQRDERLGWMGDAQVFIRTAACNADVAAFFNKWLVDVDDAQYADGRFSDVSPNSMNIGAAPGWGDAGIICPWTIYKVYGDKRVLERDWPAMVKWVEWCLAHSNNFIRDKDRGHDWGDWLAIGAKTPKDLIGTAYFAYSTHLLADAAAVLGKMDDAAKYQHLFEQIRTAFDQRYVGADGHIQSDTQTDYAMALKFELLPEELQPRAAQYLEDDVQAKKWHLSTGFIGVSYLLPALSRMDKLDTAYRLLMQDTFPSWLFSVKNGATTIWERWDGWTPDKGFQDARMNSFNHYSLGSCGEWLFGTVAGIDCDPANPGFKHIILRPRPGDGLTWARASYRSIRGRIATQWTVKEGIFALAVTIPANTSATLYVPALERSSVTEGGKSAAESPGVRFVRMEPGAAVFEVGSGSYQFAAPLPSSATQPASAP